MIAIVEVSTQLTFPKVAEHSAPLPFVAKVIGEQVAKLEVPDAAMWIWANPHRQIILPASLRTPMSNSSRWFSPLLSESQAVSFAFANASSMRKERTRGVWRDLGARPKC